MAGSDPDAIVRRYYREVVEGGRYDTAYDLFSHRHPNAGMGEVFRGIAEIHDAMPDLSVNVGSVQHGGDHARARVTLRGTLSGDLQGVAPTSQEIEISVDDSFEIVDGRISSYQSVLIGSTVDAFRFSPLPGYADVDPPRPDDDQDEDSGRDEEQAEEGFEPLPGDPDVDPPLPEKDGGDGGT